MRRPALIAPDLLRFACAAGVVAFHLGTQMWRHPSPHAAAMLAGVAPPAAGAIAAARFGWVGVELFFVISGFMIAGAVGEGGLAFGRRRLLRLAPAVWICASVTLVFLLAGGGGAAIGRWAASMAFVPWGLPVDPSYWTLGIECAFYLVMATAWRGAAAGQRADKIATVLAATSLAYWLATVLAWRGPVLMPGRAEQLLLLPHGCFFAGGIAIVRLREAGADARRLVTAAMAVAAGTLEIVHHAAEQAIELGVPAAPWLPAALVAGGVAGLALAPLAQPMLARWIDAGAARLIGLATYPLYLLHQEIGASLTGVLARAGLPTAVALAVAVVMLVLAAFGVARWAEPALRRRLDERLPRSTALFRIQAPVPRAG